MLDVDGVSEEEPGPRATSRLQIRREFSEAIVKIDTKQYGVENVKGLTGSVPRIAG